MISIEMLLTFILASILLSFAPGPDNIFVMTQSAVNGRKAGLFITLGLCSGLCIHTAAVTLGVATVFEASFLAFTALTIIGACYLLYLAWQSFRATSAQLSENKPINLSNMALYKRGIIMNVTNPKVALFFLAFLPQFVNSDDGHVTIQLLLLGAVFILVALLVFSLIAIMSGFLNTWLKKYQKILNTMAGIVFVALAIKLITTL